jgi:hypothetical protein
LACKPGGCFSPPAAAAELAAATADATAAALDCWAARTSGGIAPLVCAELVVVCIRNLFPSCVPEFLPDPVPEREPAFESVPLFL